MNLTARARQLRKQMTPEEVKLWVQLKHFNARGFNFRRQAPSNGYILDFAEFNRKLIIEVVGAQHDDPAQILKDKKRDRHFEALGFTILRFWNFQIKREMDGVIDHIQNALPPTPPALRATSPEGEEKRAP